MTARDESERGDRKAPFALDRLPPAAGDVRDLLERLPLIIYIDVPDPSSPSLYISPQTTQVLGYTPEEWASDPTSS